MAPMASTATAGAGLGGYEYLALLALCLLATLPLELVLGARVYRQPLRLVLSVACMAVPFVAWDLVGARLGHWDYQPQHITGVRLLGLPLEEHLFFVVVPVCALLTYEAVRRTLPGVSRRLRAWRRAHAATPPQSGRSR